MKRIWLILLIFVGVTLVSYSQNELDALRFSQVYYYGTSRSMGMAGAFSALGADAGSFVINPAALGLAKFSDFSFTTGFKMAQTYYNFAGQSNYDLKYKLTVNNLSAVIVTHKNNILKELNFAITYNRLIDFNNYTTIEGQNDKGSMIDYFVYMSDGVPPSQLSPFSTGLAYDTYLTDVYDSTTWSYIGANTVGGTTYYGETQRKAINQSGSGGSYDFSVALNVLDKVFFGASLSLISMDYTNVSTYSELNFPDPVELKSFNFNENLHDEVSGYAVKMGLTLVPVDFVRISFAAHTPYFLSVKDLYSSSIDSHWKTPDLDNNYDYFSQSPNNTYNYDITTPWRATAGIGLVFKKLLAVDLEADYLNYKLIRMSARDYDFYTENKAISENFYATKNFRGGAELNLGFVQLRGGVAKYGAPYQRLSDYWVYSGGIGVRVSRVYFDIAFNYRTQQEDYRFYVPYYEDEPFPKLTYKNYFISFTLGKKF